MPSTFINPLDLRKIIVEYLIGDGVLFPLIFAIVYAYVAASYGFSNRIFFMLLVIGGIMFGVLMGQAYVTFLIIILGGFLFRALSKYLA